MSKAPQITPVATREPREATSMFPPGPSTVDGGKPRTDEKQVADVELQPETSPLNEEVGVAIRNITGISWFIIVIALLSSTFLYALDNTVTATVRPSIIKTFDNRIDMLPWLSVSYPMTEVGTNPIWGKLNKNFDSKLLYLSSVLLFEIGSAVIGSAQSIEVVIVGRALAGAGGSGIYVGTMTILSAMTIPRERTQYLNFVGMTWCLGTILGPVIGGAFADSSATWRWAFYINLCIAALAAPGCIFLIPAMPSSNKLRIWQRVKEIDYIGAVLFLGGTVSIIMIMGFGGVVYQWNSGHMIGLYVVTVVVWFMFSVQQGKQFFTVDRIFPAQFVGDWEMAILFAWTAISISNVVVTVYSLPLFFQFVFGDSSLRSAVYTLPFVISGVASTGLSGPLFAKFPIYKVWFVISSSVMLIGNGLLLQIDYDISRAMICGYTVIQGVGVGPVLQLGYTVGQVKAANTNNSPTAVREATAYMSCAQMAGLALSLGIATSVFLNGATDDISRMLPGVSRQLIQGTIDGAETLLLQTSDADTRLSVLKTIARITGKVFYLNIAGAGLGFLASLLLKWERLNLDAVYHNE